jgi:hypothetical protein
MIEIDFYETHLSELRGGLVQLTTASMAGN